MSQAENTENASSKEPREELVSLLADGVLRYLARRKVDRGQRHLQFSADSLESAVELSSKPGLSVTIRLTLARSLFQNGEPMALNITKEVATIKRQSVNDPTVQYHELNGPADA